VALGILDPVIRLLLASASPARLATLRAAGIDPIVRVSSVREDEVLRSLGVSDPAEVPLVLARAKAENVAASGPGPVLVIGCDSILDLDGVALGKPGTADEAVRRWKEMRGRSALLRTGHWVIDLRSADTPAPALGATSATVVTFADLTDAEIAAYVATGEPLQVAGAFTIDGLGGAFVTGVRGDHHGVVGVSLPLLRQLIGSLGVPWHSLWRSEVLRS
jgi:septum formation protein